MSTTRTSRATDSSRRIARAALCALFASLLVALAALGCGGGDPAAETPASGCTAGTETCACGPSNACNAGLACANGACVKCPANQVDCPCVAGACEGTLVCDSATKKCRTPEPCACAPKQICERLDGTDAVCKPACEPGYDWNASAQKCDPKQTGTTCARSGDGAIGAQCAEVNKECKVVGSRAECGACLAGFKAQGSVCVAVKRCADLGCAAQNRLCVEATSSEDARCGDCTAGYVLAGNTCLPSASCQTCEAQNRVCVSAGTCGDCKSGFLLQNGQCVAALTCTGPQRPSCGDRVCVEGSPARCGDACSDPTKRWNGTSCVARLRCDTLACTGTQVCVEGRDGTTGGDAGVATNAVDAACTTQCPAGQGVNAGRCVQCASTVSCDTTRNFTGVVVAEIASAGSACFCEPAPGYFFSNTGATANQAVACDADGDGFTNDRVHGLVTANDAANRRKANCAPKVVDRAEFVFASGASIQYGIGDAFPMSQAVGSTALPLYESPRNDGEGGQSQRATGYGNEDVAAITSLTKACARRPGASGLPEDLDDNGANDVAQGASGAVIGSTFLVRASTLPAGLGRSASPALTELYQRYAVYAHFRELYTVAVEPNVGNASTFKLVIRERPVASGTSGRVAFPEVACRHADDPHVVNAPYDGTSTAWNRGMTQGRADLSTTGATADFAWVGKGLGTFDSPSTPRFRHHLTWKCVNVVDADMARQQSDVLREHYEQVARSGSSPEPRFVRWVTDGVNPTDFPSGKREISYSFEDSLSTARAFRPNFYRAAASGSWLSASDAPRASAVVGDVLWMEQRYFPHRAYERVQNPADPRGPWVSDYELGCINECAFDGASRCALTKAGVTVSAPPAGQSSLAGSAFIQTQTSDSSMRPLREFLGGTAFEYLTAAGGRFACTNETVSGSVWSSGANGAYRCGCSGATAGAQCEIGCATGAGAAREVTRNTVEFGKGFDVDRRDGLWACMGPSLTSEVLVPTSSGSTSAVSAPLGAMAGGGFELRGGVSGATFGAFGNGPGSPASSSVTTGTRTLWSR